MGLLDEMEGPVRRVIWELDDGRWTVSNIKEFFPRTRSDGKFDADTQALLEEALLYASWPGHRVEFLPAGNPARSNRRRRRKG